MIGDIIAIAAISLAAIAAIAYAFREALMRTDRAAKAEVAQAKAEGAAQTALAAADTADRLRLAETIRADTLDQELADYDQQEVDSSAPGQPGARQRVRERWRLSAAAAGAADTSARHSDTEPGAVSEPAATDAEPVSTPTS